MLLHKLTKDIYKALRNGQHSLDPGLIQELKYYKNKITAPVQFRLLNYNF